jgi:L-alanine-DL-glutamate epimerase-like enolase superfamily enzyme
MATISSIEAIHLAVPFTHDGPQSGFFGEVWTRLNMLLVKITTDDGLVGYGEAFGFHLVETTKSALEKLVAPLIIGKADDDIGGLMGSTSRALHVFGRSGPVQYALSGINIALWDIAGKRAAMPIWKLLGGVARRSVPAYASKINIGDPDQVADACAKAVARGYRGIKLHERTEETVRAARQAVGSDIALMLDVNCAWSFKSALMMAERLKPYDLAWLEEPVWPPEDHASVGRINQLTGIPVAVGENVANAWGFKHLAAFPEIEILQPSVIKVGGVSEFFMAGMAARLEGRTLAPHSPYLGPGLLATMQMAAVFPEIEWLEHYSIDLERPLFGDTGTIDSNGCIALPDAPGLGADPDQEAVERYRIG